MNVVNWQDKDMTRGYQPNQGTWWQDSMMSATVSKADMVMATTNKRATYGCNKDYSKAN